MNKAFFYIAILFFATELKAQNLVPNPSFEDMLSCPTGLGDFSVDSWFNPTTASPDYFQSCNTGDVGIPQNGFGWQSARTGNAYVGVHASDFVSSEYREYIQCQLDYPLQVGKFYKVSFYVSRTDSSTKACDNIGAFLSSTPVSSSDNLYLPYIPQIVSQPNIPIVDNAGWVVISDTICAVGGEQYITIGIFTNNINTNWVTVSGGWESEAHYYIDDVSVEELFVSLPVEVESECISLFPNPANDFLNIKSPEVVQNISIYNALGQLTFSSIPDSKSIVINLENISKGSYYVNIIANQQSITRKIIIN